MKLRKQVLQSSIALLLCATPVIPALSAQQPSAVIAPSSDRIVPPASQFPLEQILPLTVHQAWLTSGKDEATFFGIVTQLAALSAHNRDLQLPQTKEAGKQVGDMIKTMAKEDTDQLLFAIVDTAVRKVGTPMATSGNQVN